MKPDFDAMSKGELRAYVIAHPDDQDGFYAFVDRFTAEAPAEMHDIPKSRAEVDEVEQLIRNKLEQMRAS
jgi:hypothetical protein